MSDEDYNFITQEEINDLSMDIRINEPLDKESLIKYSSNWLKSFLMISNSLYSARAFYVNEGILSSDREYIFYHDLYSDDINLIKTIRNKYQKLRKDDADEGERTPHSAKWNPSDIWAVESGFELDIIERVENCISVVALNKLMDSYFISKNLIGISLKKVSNVSQNVSLIINSITNIPTYKFVNISIAPDALSTTNVKIKASRNGEQVFDYLSIRTSAGQSIKNVIVEVSGNSARHGSMSITKVNQFLRRYGLDEVPLVRDIIRYSDNELKSKIQDIQDINFIKYIRKVIFNSYGRENVITRSRLISKYQALFFAWSLLKGESSGKTDETIESIFHYALSINDGKYRTPKYVRFLD